MEKQEEQDDCELRLVVCGAVAVITKTISVRSRKYIVIQQNTRKCCKIIFKDKTLLFLSFMFLYVVTIFNNKNLLL